SRPWPSAPDRTPSPIRSPASAWARIPPRCRRRPRSGRKQRRPPSARSRQLVAPPRTPWERLEPRALPAAATDQEPGRSRQVAPRGRVFATPTSASGDSMQALTYHGAKDVRVESVPDPVVVNGDDIVLRVTATAICGSDLHLYRGKIPQVKDGDILGHEFMGIVEEVGPDVKRVQVGDRVVIPFVIACGKCFHCQLQEYAACETTN